MSTACRVVRPRSCPAPCGSSRVWRALGRVDEAREIFERVAAVANDVGLFSEEYDTASRRLVGNFPQAFTHVGFINAARLLAAAIDAQAK